MTPEAATSSLFPERPQRAVWIIAALLALLWHLLLFWVRPAWHGPALPPRVEIKQIDPKKLEAVRRQWKQREKALLLNKDKSQPKDQEAPPDARYMSDRNIRVDKEQRAKQTNVIPKPGSRAAPQDVKPPTEEARPERESPPLSKLGNLEMALKPGQKARKRQRSQDNGSTPQEGGDQALLEKNLPEGSENILNAQESVFYSFYSRLYEAIGPIWQSRIREVPYQRRVMPGEYTTVVDVVFGADGTLLEIRRIQSSGIAEFDAAVDSSWRKVGRFPNPPRGLLDEQGRVHTGWTFTVQVGKGFNLDYLPPERNY